MSDTAKRLHAAIDLHIMRLADLKGKIGGYTCYTLKDQAESALLLQDHVYELHRANAAAMEAFAWEAAQLGESHLTSGDILNITGTDTLDEALHDAAKWARATLAGEAA